uniref:Uncharacterized protein n=1 Tax=Ixodes ricinus TaxID=34613 RepID=A0A6B0U8P1_IXORI
MRCPGWVCLATAAGYGWIPPVRIWCLPVERQKKSGAREAAPAAVAPVTTRWCQQTTRSLWKQTLPLSPQATRCASQRSRFCCLA